MESTSTYMNNNELVELLEWEIEQIKKKIQELKKNG